MKRTALVLAVLGWVIFSHAPAGAQEYDPMFDDTESSAMTETLAHALENTRSGEESSWVNPDTGHSGAIVPLATYVNDEGLDCREYIQTIVIDGQEEQAYGTACRQPDGTWLIVNDEEAAAPSPPEEQTNYIYVYRNPDSYYYPWVYYDPFFYPHQIFFSFVFVHHAGHFSHEHFHEGRHHPGGEHFRSRAHDFGDHHGFGGREAPHRFLSDHNRRDLRLRGDDLRRHDPHSHRGITVDRGNLGRHDPEHSVTVRGNNPARRGFDQHGPGSVRGDKSPRHDFDPHRGVTVYRGNPGRHTPEHSVTVRGNNPAQRGLDRQRSGSVRGDRGHPGLRGNAGRSGGEHFSGSRGGAGGRYNSGQNPSFNRR